MLLYNCHNTKGTFENDQAVLFNISKSLAKKAWLYQKVCYDNIVHLSPVAAPAPEFFWGKWGTRYYISGGQR